MVVTYRDELGFVEVVIDGFNVGFVGGYAYFSAGGKNFKIKMCDLICISHKEE